MIIYLGERGTQPGSDMIAVVGYAASHEDWECVEKTWMQTLELYGASEPHMLWKKRFPYPDWPERKRMDLLESLTEIVRSHTSFGVGAILNVQDYEQFAPDWFRRENDGRSIASRRIVKSSASASFSLGGRAASVVRGSNATRSF